MSDIMNEFVGGHQELDLDDVLLSEADPIVRNHLRELQETMLDDDGKGKPAKRTLKRRRSNSGMSAKTVEAHMDAYDKAGMQWWATTLCTRENTMHFPGLLELTPRERDRRSKFSAA